MQKNDKSPILKENIIQRTKFLASALYSESS